LMVNHNIGVSVRSEALILEEHMLFGIALAVELEHLGPSIDDVKKQECPQTGYN
jgi:hypothetical protein